MKKLLLLYIIICLSLSGCRNGGGKAATGAGGDTLTTGASLLTIVDYGRYQTVDVADPWNEDKMLARYVLAPHDMSADSLPGDRTTVRVPLERSIVYSTVYAGAIDELGAIDRIKGVAEGQYFKQPTLVEGIKKGSVTDIGSSMSPNVESVIAIKPDAILTSPYQNAGHGAISTLGVPIIEMADYMEPTPLARAEWIKLLGLLYGDRQSADEMYKSTVSAYNALKQSVDSVRTPPTVVAEQVTDGVWYVPGGQSYMARLFADAGASYPWRDDKSTGSLQLDFTSVYDRAHDADFWLIRTYGDNDLTLDALKSNYPLNARMKAFNSGGVYAANTSTNTFFEDLPFHPDRILREFINIFHPELSPGGQPVLTYFKNVK